MQNPEELLAQLKDIELPAGGVFAIAPGWIVLFILFLLVVYGVYRLWLARKQRLRHWRIPALVSLDQINRQISEGDCSIVLADCSKLARRVVLAREARNEVAALTGKDWLEKLDELTGDKFFTQGHGQLLADAPYQSVPVTDPSVLQEIVAQLRLLINAPPHATKNASAKNRSATKGKVLQ